MITLLDVILHRRECLRLYNRVGARALQVRAQSVAFKKAILRRVTQAQGTLLVTL